MNQKERIILATLELAAEHGLGSVSMSMIADKLGIRKPSLYNHFESKEAIIDAMYHFLRESSRQKVSSANIDLGQLVKGRTAEEVLLMTVGSYHSMNEQDDMMSFYKVIYSQRAVDPTAAGIMADETERMILATKALFYALHAHGKLDAPDIDTAALSFAMTVHGLMDYMHDCTNCGRASHSELLTDYIKWFCKQYGRNGNEG
ncbi:MAG: TetR/AcrR family transcriptional regulator [Ruminococcus sp.]|nr:TetR/AcrR family transcriptional regulator [Ruminococcus sp.]